jgi:hypothetical protein
MLLTLDPTLFLARLFGGDGRVLVARPRVTRWQAVHVPQGSTRELPRARGRMTVHCRTGQAWIIYDGEQRDVVLQANQSHVVDRDLRLTVHAMVGDSSLELQVENV